jgi:hypothetical protein
MLTAALLLAAATPALGQETGPGAGEPELKFEREAFVYPGASRRDPFTSLAALKGMGPRFEDLTLQGVIYSPTGGSVALLSDDGGRIYRVRRGETVGNARVLSIAPTRVLFAVENFGVVRQEQLEMKRKDTEGEER